MGVKNAKMLTADESEAAVVRNVDVVSDQEQAALRCGRLLVAGCGSVGGSLVEPIVRLGLGAIVLADPENFDLSNINRQACTLADIGRSKAEVVASRALAINPNLDVRVLSDGLTEDNIESAFVGVNLVFDAVDAASSPWVKYRLHQIASQRRIPVMAGFDYGGKAVVYVFDYRRYQRLPFYGRATAEAHRSGDLAGCLKWLGYRHFPADFLPIIQDRMATGKPWPQVAHCVLAMGALGARCALELLAMRPLPHVVSFDTHMSTRSTVERLKAYLRIPPRLLGAYRASRSAPVAADTPVLSTLESVLAANPILATVLRAMVSAPSAHNCQPWCFRIEGPRQIRIGWDPARALPAVDSHGFAIEYSLGCAIEAAAVVADVEFEYGPAPASAGDVHWIGTLCIGELRHADHARNRGLLARRQTCRQQLRDIDIDPALSSLCDASVRPLRARAILARQDAEMMEALARTGADALFRDRAYLQGLLEYMRLSRREESAEPTGFTMATLSLGHTSAWLLRLFRRFPRARDIAISGGLASHMAKTSTRQSQGHSAFMLITTSNWTAAGRIDAGRAMMRAWIAATRAHLACQPMDFAISNDEGRTQVRERFGLPPSERPIALLRVGQPVSPLPPPSRRLPLSAVCTVSIGAGPMNAATPVVAEAEC